jgi:hypothetical protein
MCFQCMIIHAQNLWTYEKKNCMISITKSLDFCIDIGNFIDNQFTF